VVWARLTELEIPTDARVAPMDIDVHLPGLAAQVHILAYLRRTMLRIEGSARPRPSVPPPRTPKKPVLQLESRSTGSASWRRRSV
jgi:hypothetical protein